MENKLKALKKRVKRNSAHSHKMMPLSFQFVLKTAVKALWWPVHKQTKKKEEKKIKWHK